MSNKRVLAFDFGASSGRAMIGTFDGEKIELEEIHRFSNDPVLINNVLYWDTLRQLFEIKLGITKAVNNGGFLSIGIDTWGVDFGLIDENGDMIGNPVHYRDERNDGMMEELFKVIPSEELYDKTGLQFMRFNTIFQLYYLAKHKPEVLEKAKKLLFMPDLFAYFLTGETNSEYTILSTSQLLDPKKGEIIWDELEKLGIPKDIFPPVVDAGTCIGKLSDEICKELGAPKADFIAVASHDTASAVVSVPALKPGFVYISCGTWSLMGTELDSPVINELSAKYNVTNEGGFGRTTRFLKNIMGLWLIQESRRQWQREGIDVSFAQLEEEALACQPFRSFIDPDANDFVSPGNMPERVRDFCKRTNQQVPETRGQIMRCIYESLAMKYRNVFAILTEATEKKYNAIHIVGGGTKDKFLCQLTANACNVDVVAGPIEATALGNVAVQLIGLKEIANLAEARKVISNSFEPKNYNPISPINWDDNYERFVSILGK